MPGIGLISKHNIIESFFIPMRFANLKVISFTGSRFSVPFEGEIRVGGAIRVTNLNL